MLFFFLEYVISGSEYIFLEPDKIISTKPLNDSLLI